MKEKYYRPIATVERDGKQWDVIIIMYSRKKELADLHIIDFIEESKNKNYKVIKTRIEEV